MTLSARQIIAVAIISVSSTLVSARQPDDARLPKQAPEPLAGFMMPQARQMFADIATRPIEGIWQFMPEGTIVAIRQTDSEGIYRITAIESDCRQVLPGTLLGIIAAGGDASTFDLQLYSSMFEGRPARPKHFTLHLDASQGRMEFLKRNSAIKINLWHFIPFLWRHSIRYLPDQKDYHPGAVRLYPDPHIPIRQRPL